MKRKVVLLEFANTRVMDAEIIDENSIMCPKCKSGKASIVYKKAEGVQSVPIYKCGNCYAEIGILAINR